MGMDFSHSMDTGPSLWLIWRLDFVYQIIPSKGRDTKQRFLYLRLCPVS
jgi:hypothetical protein